MFGILEYLLNNRSNELLMIGIALVVNSAKPTIFGTGDSDEPLIFFFFFFFLLDREENTLP